MDFACSSGLRGDLLITSASNPTAVFEQYERFKRQYKDTAQACNDAGFVFTPMVCESHSGAWAPAARRVLDKIAKGIASATGEDSEVASLRFAQRISMSLHRANARAILKRSSLLEVDGFNAGVVEAPCGEMWL